MAGQRRWKHSHSTVKNRPSRRRPAWLSVGRDDDDDWRWLEATKLGSGPLFRSLRCLTVGEKNLHPCSINRMLKNLACIAGLDAATAGRLSGHSMRVGAALDMVESGIDLVPIMHARGWKSPSMVLRYTQQIDLMKSGMARLHEKRRNLGNHIG